MWKSVLAFIFLANLAHGANFNPFNLTRNGDFTATGTVQFKLVNPLNFPPVENATTLAVDVTNQKMWLDLSNLGKRLITSTGSWVRLADNDVPQGMWYFVEEWTFATQVATMALALQQDKINDARFYFGSTKDVTTCQNDIGLLVRTKEHKFKAFSQSGLYYIAGNPQAIIGNLEFDTYEPTVDTTQAYWNEPVSYQNTSLCGRQYPASAGGCPLTLLWNPASSYYPC